MIDGRRKLSWPLIGALLMGPALAEGASAQAADFLFKRPSVTLGVRLGYAVPRVESEVFDFTREQLTVDKSDFNALAVGGEVSVRVTERIDVALGLGYAMSDTRSEFREFEGTDGLPIEQDTRFRRIPLTAGVKAYLTDRGRRISRFAWIPKRWAPYVGAGVGVVWYRFEQVGEFVDLDDLDIFFEEFDSTGSSPMAYLAAGLDVSLGTKWLVNSEARYSWASAEMGRDFVGFDDIDLTGLKLALGFSVRL